MAKVSIRSGDVAIEYDGPEEFLKEQLPELVKAVNSLKSSVTKRVGGASAGSVAPDGSPPSVSTIAQKLGVDNGPDLIIAAAMSLSGAGTDSFTKKQLRARIKEATGFYKASYATNFDKSVARLVKKGRLHHNGGDSYALPASDGLQPEAA